MDWTPIQAWSFSRSLARNWSKHCFNYQYILVSKAIKRNPSPKKQEKRYKK